jgi:hypothetical protein
LSRCARWAEEDDPTFAAWTGEVGVINVICRHQQELKGVDPDAQDGFGQTAEDCFEAYGRAEIKEVVGSDGDDEDEGTIEEAFRRLMRVVRDATKE